MEDLSCPYASLTAQTHFFCEEGLCGYVKYPADTWTLVAFVISGLLILRGARRDGARELWVFGALTILVGVASAPVHVTGTYVGQVIDLWSMFMLASYLCADAVRRVFTLTLHQAMALMGVLAAASTGHMILTAGSGLFVFAVTLLAAVTFEALFLRRHRDLSVRPLATVLLVFAGSFGIWCLDYFRIACVPTNHVMTGHGIWHCLNAVVLYLLFLYLRGLKRASALRQSA